MYANDVAFSAIAVPYHLIKEPVIFVMFKTKCQDVHDLCSVDSLAKMYVLTCVAPVEVFRQQTPRENRLSYTWASSTFSRLTASEKSRNTF